MFPFTLSWPLIKVLMDTELALEFQEYNTRFDPDPNWDSIISTSKIEIPSAVDSSTKSQTSTRTRLDLYLGVDIIKNKPLDEIEILTDRVEQKSNCMLPVKRPKSKKGQNVLREFFRISKPKKLSKNQTGVEKEPKKEYFRVKLIRGHKRVMRKIIDGILDPPTTTINKIEKNNKDQLKCWALLVDHTRALSSELEKICLTYNGPLTDGKSFRKKKSIEHDDSNTSISKTFNNSFSSAYFSTAAVLENFRLYIDYLFISQSSQSLKKKFNFFCCKVLNCKLCDVKWNILHEFTKFVLTADLSIKTDFVVLEEDYENDSQFFVEDE